ncbi:MAG TPA: metal-dependent transcriptional regulator [bacterium]|nr:metal-dependent transcriptional regulator [Candidatus Omnitrophota bacterium]HOJ59525.1 metal-dependent transcriptional regulator [bacterium]HOL96129.1 metal-dependent transcriptional regulator [bacterium]HPP01291.1 metal-dependent transcriptional regulator [bacterium]HXK93289.1 metal-dependent transcriptional regulator [bacterium]
MMPRLHPGPSAEDYLKTVYKLSREHRVVIPAMVAGQLGISSAAVTKMVKRLREQNLIRYSRSQGIRLTAAGEKIALRIIRHHRLIELYLIRALEFTWDQVHEEAERLEHVISDFFSDKIDAYLGFPTRDPHGAPIPTKDGRIEDTLGQRLTDLQPGQRSIIHHVSNDDAALLRYLAELGMFPGVEVKMVTKEPFGGPYRIVVSGKTQIIGPDLANQVYMSP